VSAPSEDRKFDKGVMSDCACDCRGVDLLDSIGLPKGEQDVKWLTS
jgi:hypothetical protein